MEKEEAKRNILTVEKMIENFQKLSKEALSFKAANDNLAESAKIYADLSNKLSTLVLDVQKFSVEDNLKKYAGLADISVQSEKRLVEQLGSSERKIVQAISGFSTQTSKLTDEIILEVQKTQESLQGSRLFIEEDVKNNIDKLTESIQKKMDYFIKILKEIAKQNYDEVTNSVNGATQLVENAVSNNINDLKNTVKDSLDSLQKSTQDIEKVATKQIQSFEALITRSEADFSKHFDESTGKILAEMQKTQQSLQEYTLRIEYETNNNIDKLTEKINEFTSVVDKTNKIIEKLNDSFKVRFDDFSSEMLHKISENNNSLTSDIKKNVLPQIEKKRAEILKEIGDKNYRLETKLEMIEKIKLPEINENINHLNDSSERTKKQFWIIIVLEIAIFILMFILYK